ncbi:hypothetical protein Hanom_Chr03g00268301 [Helianthus anomalus]
MTTYGVYLFLDYTYIRDINYHLTLRFCNGKSRSKFVTKTITLDVNIVRTKFHIVILTTHIETKCIQSYLKFRAHTDHRARHRFQHTFPFKLKRQHLRLRIRLHFKTNH